ncbi:1-acyl-sn-glycerol-3-phosphate acyltransferase [Parasulfuritortus cantonensis]|uniref:1-acyl-sn-glycerol-3-phosphate acyltransferase n=1 Tax=Parasulfuritortus cantonensis TaxID=2528202 RepID=A0A4R1BCY1_9PROT|nr:lysophospholipid acyltransferase family protein [Parasulfuritortus cantonensis]TCJ14930.1 1-acyl-sn-glycerol-3-phosphate acyltransferase [Parasulfuritortus cantonensis]
MPSLAANLRQIRLAGHLLAGVATVLFLFPFLDRGEREKRLVRWAAGLLAVVGVRIAVKGRPPAVRGGGALIVANHVSWLDIHVIHSLLPARFISKAEVRDWPVIGWLADKAGGTLFLERTRKSDARRMNELMAGHLRDGDCLALFPEGTTSDGGGLLPFYPGLFQPAVAAEAAVWPARIRYLDAQGGHSTAAAYFGDMSLLTSVRNITRASGLVAEIEFLPAIAARGLGRKELAARAESAIRAALVAGAPGSAPGTDGCLQAGSR